jgi:predicted transglutaminase-like cysteine proteinase
MAFTSVVSGKFFRVLQYLSLLFATHVFLVLAPAQALSANSAFIVSKGSISAPAGFSGTCSKYSWLCRSTGGAPLSDEKIFRLAAAVNTQVNRRTRSLEDIRQYGREEYWALPTPRGGDCEDFALLKKKILISEYGVPGKQLLIATVLDHRLQRHAVLVLRTSRGDFILDNLDNKIRHWTQTGYTFLKLQNPNALDRWVAVLAGGIINDRPTGASQTLKR